MHIGGTLNCCGGAWACFELTFSSFALACRKTHAKLLLVYFFSQSQFCKTKGINMEYIAIFSTLQITLLELFISHTEFLGSFCPIVAKQNSL